MVFCECKYQHKIYKVRVKLIVAQPQTLNFEERKMNLTMDEGGISSVDC